MYSTLLKADDVAEMLNVCVDTVYRLKDIPRIKIGRNYRYDRKEVEKWIKEKAQPKLYQMDK